MVVSSGTDSGAAAVGGTPSPRRGPGRPPRLTADDWAAAALEALADGGLAAVAVEPVATRLGTSKGGFYWYFKDRAALVAAALARWERLETERVVAVLAAIADPAERLRTLIRHALRESRGASVALLLLADAADPLVGATVRRVTDRRLAVVTDCFAALGQPPATARHHALAGYSAYLGAAALRRGAPGAAPELDDAYVDSLLAAFGVPPGAGGAVAR